MNGLRRNKIKRCRMGNGTSSDADDSEDNPDQRKPPRRKKSKNFI